MRGLTLLVSMLLASQAQAELLTGVVLQEDGQPAAGAVVNVAGIFRNPPLRLSTTADQQGKFRIEAPPLLGSASYILAVRWEQQGAQVRETVDSQGKPTEINAKTAQFMTIRLKQGGELRGRLLQAENDAPIAGARLYLDTGEVLTTDSNGAYSVRGLPLADHSLIPVARGRVHEYVLFDTTLRPDAELDLRLPRGAVVQGTITDEAGRPIPGAYLSQSSSGHALTKNGWDELCSAEGAFEYGGLSTQRLFYNLEARAPGYQSQTISAELTSPDQLVTHHVKLAKKAAPPPAATYAKPGAVPPPVQVVESSSIRRAVSGKVTDAAGSPIANATVRWAADLWDDSVKPTRTDNDGTFTVQNVPEGSAAFLVLAKGFAPKFASVASLSEGPIELDPGVEVRGVIENSGGSPVSGARVVLVTRCFDTGFCNPIWLDERSARSDDKGQFVISHVPATGVQFDVLKQGYSEQRDLILTPGPEPNNIRLVAGGGITGWVLKGPDRPVRDFRVRVMIPRTFDRDRDKVGGYFAGFQSQGIRFTRNDGVFTLTDVNADHWHRLLVSSPGVGYAVIDRAPSRPLDQLPPPETLTITLKPFRALSVIVQDEKGQAIRNARVALLEDKESLQNGFQWGLDDLWSTRQTTDAAGKATFSEPACDDGVVTVIAPGYAHQCLEWRGEAGPLTVTMTAGATLKGEVRVAEILVKSGYIQLEDSNQIRFGADFEKSNGLFEFEGLPAGDYQAIVEVDGREQAETVSLAAGETRTLKINLKTEKR